MRTISTVLTICYLAFVGVVAAAETITPVSPDTQGTGTRDDPHVFDTSTPCILSLPPSATKVTWHLKDGPPGAFVLTPNLVAFTLAEPRDDYVVHATWLDADATTVSSSLVWVSVRSPSPGPGPGPSPLVPALAKRVNAAFVGQPPETILKDKDIFASTLTALVQEIDAGNVTKVSILYAKLDAGLKANKWTPQRYPDITALFGEMFGGSIGGPGVPDATLSPEWATRTSADLNIIIKALQPKPTAPPPPLK